MGGLFYFMNEYYVYILQCNDESYYTGVTNDYEKRVSEHQCGIDPQCYTYKRRPVKLVHLEKYSEIWDAIRREKELKGWNRKKKHTLIQKRFESLPNISKRKWAHFSEERYKFKNRYKYLMYMHSNVSC